MPLQGTMENVRADQPAVEVTSRLRLKIPEMFFLSSLLLPVSAWITKIAMRIMQIIEMMSVRAGGTALPPLSSSWNWRLRASLGWFHEFTLLSPDRLPPARPRNVSANFHPVLCRERLLFARSLEWLLVALLRRCARPKCNRVGLHVLLGVLASCLSRFHRWQERLDHPPVRLV